MNTRSTCSSCGIGLDNRSAHSSPICLSCAGKKEQSSNTSSQSDPWTSPSLGSRDSGRRIIVWIIGGTIALMTLLVAGMFWYTPDDQQRVEPGMRIPNPQDERAARALLDGPFPLFGKELYETAPTRDREWNKADGGKRSVRDGINRRHFYSNMKHLPTVPANWNC